MLGVMGLKKIYCDEHTSKPSLDLPKIYGIHLFILGLNFFGFGTFHVICLLGAHPYELIEKSIIYKFNMGYKRL